MLERLLRARAAGRSAALRAFKRPVYDEADGQDVARTTFLSPAGDTQWYPPVMLGAQALGAKAASAASVEAAREVLALLEPDDYGRYLAAFYEDGLRRFGSDWGYADLVTSLHALSQVVQPRRYLEIGVRRGRSACTVARACPTCDMALFDMWIANYAGMENPGPEFVRGQLQVVGHRAAVEFIDGDSHKTLPQYFRSHPGSTFDLITVDGDHSDEGAAQDLRDVLPRLAVGGCIAFDDIAHPQHPGLAQVWRDLVAEDPRFSAWSYDEAGYGVGIAIRKW